MYVFFIGYMNSEVFRDVGFVIIDFIALGGFLFGFGWRGGFVVIEVGVGGGGGVVEYLFFVVILEILYVV